MYVSSRSSTSFEGVVTKIIRGAYAVTAGSNSQICTLASAESPALGDVVCCNSTGQIVAVLPRRNQLARRSAAPMPGAHPHPQVIAANIDQMVPILATADPKPAWNLLDRYLVSAEAAEIPAVICLTKFDLVTGEAEGQEIETVAEDYRAIGYPVILTSAVNGAGLAQLEAALQGQLSLLVGKSGVGKTTLLNALEPGLGLHVQPVRAATGKGRHTTAHHEIFPLHSSGAVIDTPGIREFGLWDVDEDDLAYFFPEMRPLLGRCKFRLDCHHDEEPGCAIRQAVNNGQIGPYRYQSYLKLRAEP